MRRKPRRDPRDRLEDVHAATRRIADKVSDREFKTFAADRDAIDVVCLQVLIIGEAVESLPDDLKQQHPEIDWRGIKAMRNLLVHVYWKIDPRIVWHTATIEVPALRRVIETYLQREAGREGGEPSP